MAHSRSSPLMVLRFSRWHLSLASLVIKLMNSGYALLDRLLGVLGDLRVRGQRFLHDATDVGNWQEAILFSNVTALLVVVVVDALAASSAASLLSPAIVRYGPRVLRVPCRAPGRVLVAMLTRGIWGFREPGRFPRSIRHFRMRFASRTVCAYETRIPRTVWQSRAFSVHDRRVKNLDVPRADVFAVLKVRVSTLNFRRRLKI